MNLVNEYTKLNNSFDKTLLFGVGLKAGFYSEINNMILGVLYCLQHKIQFNLQSLDANFGYKNGWTDYFEPFCREKNKHHLAKQNYRMPMHVPQYNSWQKQKISWIKKWHKVDFFTYELFDLIRNRENEKIHYDFPTLGIKGDILDATAKIIDLVYRPNAEVIAYINQKKKEIALPSDYIGFHIRGGDKFLEHDLLDADNYFKAAEELSGIRKAFILTDDFAIFEKIQQKYPHWQCFTITDKDESGYFHESFKDLKPEVKKSKIMNLIASIELLSEAEVTFCTYSSNVGMFLKMRNKNRTFGIDLPSWQIW